MIFQFFSFLLHTVFSAGIIGNFFFSFLPSSFFWFPNNCFSPEEADVHGESRSLQAKGLFSKPMDFSGVVVRLDEPQCFCAYIQLSGSVPAGNKRNESIDLVRYKNTPSKNGVYFYFTKKKLGERMRPSKRETALHGTIGIFAVDVVG